jgi:hypothetical protein
MLRANMASRIDVSQIDVQVCVQGGLAVCAQRRRAQTRDVFRTMRITGKIVYSAGKT